jgi:cell division protein FtsQ
VEQENLPRLNGPQGQSAQVLSMCQALQSLLTPVNLSIEMLELTGRGNWHAELDTGASIELGRGMEDEVKERAVRFVGTLAQVTSRYGRTAAALEMADLRHKDGYAIRLRGVSTVQTEQQK